MTESNVDLKEIKLEGLENIYVSLHRNLLFTPISSVKGKYLWKLHMPQYSLGCVGMNRFALIFMNSPDQDGH